MIRAAQPFAFCLVCFSGIANAAEAPTPALRAYEEVSVYRDPHSDVIYDGKAATADELARIADDLRRGLHRMDDADIRDLAEGSVYLRYRRFNLLIDLVKIEARAGRSEQALEAWDALSRMSWSGEALSTLTEDPHVSALMQDPRYASIRARQQAATWLVATPSLASPYRDELPVEERIAGLSRLWSAAREGFVWFDHVPHLDWDRAYLDALPRVMAATNTEAYYRELMRFTALLQDGHSNAYPPEALQPRFYSRPGLRTARIADHVLVTDIRDPALEKHGLVVGDEVMTIDGQPVATYAEREIAPYQSSSTPQDREVRTYTYALLSGPAERPVRLGLRRANGERYEIEASRSGYQARRAPPTQSFEKRSDGVAVLSVRQFENDAGVSLLRGRRDEVEKARALVIDLRGNGGGSSHYGWQILAHLAAGPVPTPRSFVSESTPLSRAQQGRHAAIEWRPLEGGSYETKTAWTFSGPVALLIDARTFSAAEDTAAAFKLMRRGRIYGSASGGSTGQPWSFALPGGGSARICVKRDQYPDGSSFVGVGVLPDVPLEPSVEDVRTGRDAVLERAVADLLATPENEASRRRSP